MESDVYAYIKALENHGIEILDFTPYINKNREKEIEYYLETHKEIDEFLILDDDYFFEKWNGHQILIDLGFGLTISDFQIAINILNGNLQPYDIKNIEQSSEKRLIKSHQKYQKN